MVDSCPREPVPADSEDGVSPGELAKGLDPWDIWCVWKETGGTPSAISARELLNCSSDSETVPPIWKGEQIQKWT